MIAERLPSSLVIHKRVDCMDTRLTQLDGQLANNPLENKLGFFNFGKCTQAADDAKFAYVNINKICGTNPLKCRWTQKKMTLTPTKH
jgi:hypothetical protein